jgi:hypothetical protein
MKNIVTSWKTTLIGIAIIGAALASIFFGKSWEEASIGLAIGVGLMFAPDKILNSINGFK